MNSNWREMWEKYYDDEQVYGDVLYKRSIGELPEKNSSRAFALLLKDGLYKSGDKLVDIGCATGHFLRSFRDHLDPDVDYTGIDFNPYYIDLAKKAYGKTAKFVVGDAFELDFRDESFDTAVINLFHHFDDPAPALAEALRVSQQYCVWRTPTADVTHLVKVLKGETEKEANSKKYYLFNLYSRKFILECFKRLGVENDQISFVLDTDNTAFSNKELFGPTAAKSDGTTHVVGNLLTEWTFVVIKK